MNEVFEAFAEKVGEMSVALTIGLGSVAVIALSVLLLRWGIPILVGIVREQLRLRSNERWARDNDSEWYDADAERGSDGGVW